MSGPRINIVELRQYTLKPGRRDDLIALFERQFVEGQEREGMTLIGTFRDADDPDRFVWLRGFADMESRARALAAFYGGPVWQAHRNAANDTMIDSDNVLLLRPAWNGADFPKAARAPVGATGAAKGVVLATIHHFAAPVAEAFVSAFRALDDPDRIAACVTEASENTFPRLPVREGENVLVNFSLFPDTASAKPAALPPELMRQVKRKETLHLIPTARSSLHA